MSTHCCVLAKLRPLPYERENNISLQAIRFFLLSIKSHVMSLIEFLAKQYSYKIWHESVSLWECLYTTIFEKLYLKHTVLVAVLVFETGLSHPVKYFTDRSKVVLLSCIFCVFLSCV